MRLRILVREARQARADTEAGAKRLEEEAAELEKRKQLDEQAAARLLKQKELEIQRKIQAKKERKKSQAVATGILGTESSSASSSELARNS
ncbi:hypothetical protein ID866_9080 [Astraeus odoratus]|nr:hypothetical protein ID866_9080 [Astraeus odoratus]